MYTENHADISDFDQDTKKHLTCKNAKKHKVFSSLNKWKCAELVPSCFVTAAVQPDVFSTA